MSHFHDIKSCSGNCCTTDYTYSIRSMPRESKVHNYLFLLILCKDLGPEPVYTKQSRINPSSSLVLLKTNIGLLNFYPDNRFLTSLTFFDRIIIRPLEATEREQWKQLSQEHHYLGACRLSSMGQLGDPILRRLSCLGAKAQSISDKLIAISTSGR